MLIQHPIIRYATQEGDANGVVRGQYAYLDPNYQWQQVSKAYVRGVSIELICDQKLDAR